MALKHLLRLALALLPAAAFASFAADIAAQPAPEAADPAHAGLLQGTPPARAMRPPSRPPSGR